MQRSAEGFRGQFWSKAKGVRFPHGPSVMGISLPGAPLAHILFLKGTDKVF